MSAYAVTKARSKRLVAEPRMAEDEVFKTIAEMLGGDLHQKRLLSMTHGVLGVLQSASAAISTIGQGLALARGLNPKHAVKQVDRLLSNGGINVWDLFSKWVPFVLADRKDIIVTLDWTDHAHDGQCTIALNMVTSHGRATPLMWKTVGKNELKARRNGYEDDVLVSLRDIVPADVRITVLADRGFGDQKLYAFAKEQNLDYVIRFRQDILVTNVQGEARSASEWVAPNGHARRLGSATVTIDHAPVPVVVCVKHAGMKDAWGPTTPSYPSPLSVLGEGSPPGSEVTGIGWGGLASSRADLTGAAIVKLYGKRFTTEENFRDTKDIKFGLGLSATHIGTPERRDRLLLLCAVSQALLTLLGAACERTGLDKRLKVNTAKKRTHSLFRQGLYWYAAIPNMPDDWLRPLMDAFTCILQEHAILCAIYGVI